MQILRFSVQNSENVDASRAFLWLTVTKLSTLKQVQLSWRTIVAYRQEQFSLR